MATPTPIISKNPLSISLPLTAPTGKIRVKQRDTFFRIWATRCRENNQNAKFKLCGMANWV